MPCGAKLMSNVVRSTLVYCLKEQRTVPKRAVCGVLRPRRFRSMLRFICISPRWPTPKAWPHLQQKPQCRYFTFGMHCRCLSAFSETSSRFFLSSSFLVYRKQTTNNMEMMHETRMHGQKHCPGTAVHMLASHEHVISIWIGWLPKVLEHWIGLGLERRRLLRICADAANINLSPNFNTTGCENPPENVLCRWPPAIMFLNFCEFRAEKQTT